MTESSSEGQKVTRADIESVSEKLAKLAKDLPESERAVLGLVLARAQVAPEDADLSEASAADLEKTPAGDPAGRRVLADQPFAGQLARAAGLFAKPEVTVVVGWQYRFGLTDGLDDVVLPADPGIAEH